MRDGYRDECADRYRDGDGDRYADRDRHADRDTDSDSDRYGDRYGDRYSPLLARWDACPFLDKSLSTETLFLGWRVCTQCVETGV